MADLTGFNSQDHKDPSFEPLPEGKYLLIVEASEAKPTKAGTGTGINLKFQVVDGKHKGRTFFHWLNYEHASADAQRIGRAELAMLCRAVNVPGAKDTLELHNIPFCGTVKVTPGKDGYGPGNKLAKAEPKAAFAAAVVPDAKAGGAPWGK